MSVREKVKNVRVAIPCLGEAAVCCIESLESPFPMEVAIAF